MEYRGKQYTIVQEADPDCWRWTVYLTSGRDVSPLNISGSLFFDAESWLFHFSYFCVT
jgi:hypothetical protein